MGCNPWNNKDVDSCVAYQPGDGSGVSIEFKEYPLAPVRSGGSYNIPEREGIATMNPSITLCGSPIVNNSAGNCGKPTRAVPAGWNNLPSSPPCVFVYDNYPSEISFDYGYSDRWFSYLYDTSNDQGIIGTPCYYYETENTSTTDGTTTTEGGNGGQCFICTNFTCAPATTTLSYTMPEGTATGDPDCPHPTVFGFGSDKNKLAFSYDSLSTTLPNGVTDFSFSYSGGAYADAWNQAEVTGILYSSSQNPPYQSGDESLDDFVIFELDDVPNNKTGLRVKVEVKSIYDDSGASTVFTGTSWLATEVLNPGTGYAVNDVFTLNYTHTHPDNSTSTLTVNLKVTGVGPNTGVGDASGFDVLRAGDTINGHEITRTFHTDMDNFPYHIIYLDGAGNDFTKETQYTSSRNHVITAKAGFGIKDRAILMGMYEFLEKSIQYTTADIDKNAPDVYNTQVQPEVTPTITGGILTGVSIVSGGSGWNKLGREPEVIVTPPMVESGTGATVKAEFTNGVMTAIKVVTGGSGYSSTSLPKIAIINDDLKETDVHDSGLKMDEYKDDAIKLMDAWPDGEISWSQAEKDNYLGEMDKMPVKTVVNSSVPNFSIKFDPNRERVEEVGQYGYSKKVTDPLREAYEVKHSFKHFDDLDLDRSYKDVHLNEKERNIKSREEEVDSVTQFKIPEYYKANASLVETVQGPTSSLPHASTYTKYFLKQYRPDPTVSTNLSVTLSCTPVNAGCAHFSCPPPSAQAGGTVDNGDGTTTTTTYVMSGLLGDGCKAWTATGSFKIWNDMSSSATQFVNAVAAYGNPFPE